MNNQCWAIAAAVTVTVGTWVSPAAWAQHPPIVGEMTMVIGQVKLLGADGVVRSVQRGGSVRVGDRIETQAGGHLHLRFVDGGRLSIRPASVLQIEEYSHSAQQPQLGAIKFRLDEGVVRSITGTWGEAARDRFRLNTPVAAIGVKGTDFVVRAEGNQTLASVYTGAITLTPMDSGCLASVGPCINGHEKLLSEDMKGQMIELNRQQLTPQLVPLVDLLARSSLRSSPSHPTAANPTAAMPIPASALVSDSRAATVVTASIQSLAAAPIPPLAPIEPPPVPEPVVIVAVVTPVPAPAPVVAEPPPVVVDTVAVAPLPTLPQVKQLSWGRVPWIEKMNADTFTRNWNDAVASSDERIVGVGIGTYNLFRTPSPAGAVLTSSDVRADFRLAHSTAQVVREAGRVIEPVNVTGGSLTVDFARSTFATQLGLHNAAIGADTVTASGSIQSNGVLQTVNSNATTLTGALTLDGKEAGYTFNKPAHNGSGFIYGATLWGR